MTKPISEPRAARTSRKSASMVDLLGSNSEIARKLKQYHDELLSLEVPDRFSDLLTQLEEAERSRTAEVAASKAEG
jgi:Anti-sigma factor NepR